ncbi:MAG: GNAT family N-acetyltransferase [Bacteroidetes bacterium]|nr:GNAT family N-acetyltransferase [Bacteroidota bacterium]
MQITIREATEKDITSLIDFQLKMALETENLTLDIATLTQGVKRLLKDSTKGRYYVAVENEAVIGCLMTTYEWSDWRCGTVIWIQSVYINGSDRGKGVYKKLYLHIQQMVEADPDLRGIRLYVDKTNLAAKEVYTRLGMNGDHYQAYEWMKS